MNKLTKMIPTLIAAAGLLFGGIALAADTAPAQSTPPAHAPAHEMGWFGGEAYTGEPALVATAALVKAGGGADNFSFATALTTMLGAETVNAEVAKLTEQFGAEKVGNFIEGMDLAVNLAIKDASAQGIVFPDVPADLTGTKLATTLVNAGTGADGTFWSGILFDKALSHPIHLQVMAQIEAKHDRAYDKNIHLVLNQAMYDVAQALKIDGVKLATAN